ncbi:hypothetical protein [Luteipulveratus halotolerans]|uniref:Acetyltransferase-like protein n=1 Tax=Luteipulveratus halotolerans TaxID=1631356 RepID=A0A0L6CK41_9MICO|nr:hypothetical protein [Luteipulveratus halotolerans]KNX37970.1 acetyltransferase-like protein [Luteipulveratus halotolerans]
MDGLQIATLAERPDLVDRWYDVESSWPTFIGHDPIGDALWDTTLRMFPEYAVVATRGDEVVARGRSVPFAYPTQERAELPASGWDRALIWAMLDHEAGVKPTAASALEIQIGTPYRGQGLSPVLVGALRESVAAQGISTLYAPVRPNGKTDPHQPMSEYAALTRPDGLPVDPWLRVHVRAGATIEEVAPASMVVPGSLQEWREWTGLPFDEDGDVVVPQALAPVRCHLAEDLAVYVEPNVWVRHGLA